MREFKVLEWYKITGRGDVATVRPATYGDIPKAGQEVLLDNTSISEITRSNHVQR